MNKRIFPILAVLALSVLWLGGAVVRVYCSDAALREYIVANRQQFNSEDATDLDNSTFDLFTAWMQFLKNPFNKDVGVYYFRKSTPGKEWKTLGGKKEFYAWGYAEKKSGLWKLTRTG